MASIVFALGADDLALKLIQTPKIKEILDWADVNFTEGDDHYYEWFDIAWDHSRNHTLLLDEWVRALHDKYLEEDSDPRFCFIVTDYDINHCEQWGSTSYFDHLFSYPEIRNPYFNLILSRHDRNALLRLIPEEHQEYAKKMLQLS